MRTSRKRTWRTPRIADARRSAAQFATQRTVARRARSITAASATKTFSIPERFSVAQALLPVLFAARLRRASAAEAWQHAYSVVTQKRIGRVPVPHKHFSASGTTFQKRNHPKEKI